MINLWDEEEEDEIEEPEPTSKVVEKPKATPYKKEEDVSKKSNKATESDEELDAEFISGPGETKHDVKLKKSKDGKPKTPSAATKKPAEKSKSGMLKLFLKCCFVLLFKVSVSDSKPRDTDAKDKKAPPVPKKPASKAVDSDEELDAEFIDGPEEAKHDVKFKSPTSKDTGKKPSSKDRPSTSSTKKSSSKPKDSDEEMDTDLIAKPEDPKHDVKYKSSKKKPASSKVSFLLTMQLWYITVF